MSSQPTSDSNDGAERSNLGKFAKASFAAYLYHALTLVNAIPKRDSPTMDDIRKDLEVCLTVIVAAMNNEQNKSDIQTITDALETYCKGHPETNQRQAFVEAANAALIFLQPLSIGNSRDAVTPDSDDFVWFMRQDRAINGASDKSKSDNRMPDICCATKKNIMEGQSRDQYQPAVEVEQLLKDLASQPEPDRLLEWKQYDSCWESIRTMDSLDISPPLFYGQGYAGASLKEYGHTENYNPPPIVYLISDSEISKFEANLHDVNMDLNPPGEPSIVVHSLNVKWCMEDAKNVFYDTFGRNHVMNVAINDELLRVWYFDHESTIQTSAFNFIQDLPYFLLFLFALQRFTRTNWGCIEQLSPVNAKAVEPVDLTECMQETEATRSSFTFKRLDNDFQAQHRMSLSGRATHVIYGNLFSVQWNNVSVVLKLSWREKARFPEGHFLREAIKHLRDKGFSDVCDYLPDLLAERDFPDFATDTIRRNLLIPTNAGATRVPYFIVIPMYEPITVRTKNWLDFYKDYMALIYCHFMLWSVGIEHADISVGNLMWDPQTQQPKLCDFDLSHYSDHEYTGFKNTGTLMFMASDLLSKEAMDGKVKRLYRHDLESFVAVFIWIISRYNEGCVIPGTLALREWIAKTPGECAKAREDTYTELLKTNCPEHLPPNVWNLARELVFRSRYMVEMAKMSRLIQNYAAGKETSPDSDSEVPEFSEEEKKDQKKKWKHSRSINVITDFLSAFAHVHRSTFVQNIANKIRARIGYLDTLQKS